MAAGFQGDNKGSTKGRISRLGQGPHLGMGLSGAGMEALTNQSALPAQNHSPHQGDWDWCVLQLAQPAPGPGASRRPTSAQGQVLQRERHSPTT